MKESTNIPFIALNFKLPAQSPGAFSINNQSITLNLRTFYPSVGVLISGNVTNTFKNYCGESKTRTYNLKAMTLASYQLLHFAV